MNSPSPLAEQLRPTSLNEIVGQDHLLMAGKPVAQMVATKRLSSMILWGPPGSGKTTLAQLLAKNCHYRFTALSALSSGVADLKKVFQEAEASFQQGEQTLLFIDEIHRFNRTQQDTFLSSVERGIITLVGATTENPSFALNKALLSRCQVFVLKRLNEQALGQIYERAQAYLNLAFPLTDDAKQTLMILADGDGRAFLNMLEILATYPTDKMLSSDTLTQILAKRVPLYDRGQDEHYNLISVLHKSIRGSDVDAALYWLARMLAGGEDPLYLARRLIRCASEDIGMADPQALVIANAAAQTYERLGSPEGELAIAHAVVFLATAPKSNAVYSAYKRAQKAAQKSGSLMPPKTILNAPTKLMKDLDYGEGYIYDHDTEEGFSGQNYFPEQLSRQNFYTPVERGFEREIKKRLDYWQRLRNLKE